MEKHFKKHIEDDQNQLLAEARGLIGANSGGGGGSGGGACRPAGVWAEGRGGCHDAGLAVQAVRYERLGG